MASLFGVSSDVATVAECVQLKEQMVNLMNRQVTVNLILRAKRDLQDKVALLDGLKDKQAKEKAAIFLRDSATFLSGLDEAVDKKLQMEALNELSERARNQMSLIEESIREGQMAKAKIQFNILSQKCQKLWTKENLTKVPSIQKLALRFRDLKKMVQGGASRGETSMGFNPSSSAMGDDMSTISGVSYTRGPTVTQFPSRSGLASSPSAGGGGVNLLSNGMAPIENVFYTALKRAKIDRPTETALYCGAKRLAMTWSEVSLAAEGFASYLVSMGVTASEIVCIAMINPTYHSILIQLGTLLAGAKVGPIHYRMEAAKVAHQLAVLSPRVLVVDDVLAPLVKIAAKAARPPLVVFVGSGEPPMGSIHVDSIFAFESDPHVDWSLAPGHSMEIGSYFNVTEGAAKPKPLTVKVKHVLTLMRDVAFKTDDVVFHGIPVYHFGAIGLILAVLRGGAASVTLREKIPALTYLKLLRVTKTNIVVTTAAALTETITEIPSGTSPEDSVSTKVTHVFVGPSQVTTEVAAVARALFPKSTCARGFGTPKEGAVTRTLSTMSFGSLDSGALDTKEVRDHGSDDNLKDLATTAESQSGGSAAGIGLKSASAQKLANGGGGGTSGSVTPGTPVSRKGSFAAGKGDGDLVLPLLPSSPSIMRAASASPAPAVTSSDGKTGDKSPNPIASSPSPAPSAEDSKVKRKLLGGVKKSK